MNMTDSNPWVLFLGANSDMATASARCFAKSGYNIYLASRNTDELQKTAQDIEVRCNVQARALFFDIRDFRTHNDFYKSLDNGPEGVIVAAGVMHEPSQIQKSFDLAREMMEVNYLGPVSILEIIAADFSQRRKGFIVGISSVAGDRGRQSNYIYGSSKAALTTYLAGLRHRLADTGVSVLNVKPGFVATKMTGHLDLPPLLTASTEQVAKAIFNAVKKKKSVIYVKPVWRLIMLIIIHMPEFIFHKTRL